MPNATIDGVGTGKTTQLSGGLVARMTQALRYTITGVTPETWMSPQQPIAPVAPPEVAGRLWNYQPGYNLNQSPRPNSGGQDIYELLRTLGDVDIVRAVIETRKDQLIALPWGIKVKDGKKGDYTKKIEEVETFLQRPDGYHTFSQWLCKLLEDMFVLDAATIYRRRDRAGRMIALDVMDGATVAVKIDEYGRIPLAPNPAFQQILNGVPAADYTTDQIFYMPRKLRNNSVYGFGPVEQIAFTINLIMQRMVAQEANYDTGNIPPGLLELPLTMTKDKIEDFMTTLNSRLSGNTQEKAKLYPVPNGTKYQEIKKPTIIEAEVEEWLTRVVCFAFSISPQPFIKMMNRATAQTAHDAALNEGLGPLQLWVKSVFDQVIAIEFGLTDLEFAWMDDRELDPQVAMEINTGYTKAGITSIDWARDKIGEAPLGGAFAIPMVLVSTGYVAIKSTEEQAADAEVARQAMLALPGPDDDEDPSNPDGSGTKSSKNPNDNNAKKVGLPKTDDKKPDGSPADKAAHYHDLAKGASRKLRPVPFPASPQ